MNPGENRQRRLGWKAGLALVCLALSALLWVNGLVESLGRPSVGNDLSLRQLELSALAAPEVPPALRPLLVGEDPEAVLLQELDRQATAENNLLRALLQLKGSDPAQARPLLETLRDQGDPVSRSLVRRLLDGPVGDGGQEPMAGPLPADPLLRRLSCAALGGRPQSCADPAAERRAALQLVGVSVLPALALLAGVGLILREGWLRWRGKTPPLPPVVGPPLGAIDLILLIAGGFVLLGELITPLVVSPLIRQLLRAFQIGSPLAEGLTVLLLYLGLMAAPLTILTLMLRGEPPEGGWLQYRWRPPWPPIRQGFKGLLIVLPLVSLTGWLQQLVWSEAGGSNPLLELVLRSNSGWTLFCFAFTAIVLAPLFEETLFRGVLLPVMARRLGPVWGVVLSSIVFGMAHLSLGELTPLVVLGLALGWCRLSSGRLSSSIWLHAFWNALTFSNLVMLGG